MEISVRLPSSDEAFQPKREPDLVAPEPMSLLNLSAGVLSRFLLSRMRERCIRCQLAADKEKAILRNLANLDWALRQNVEDAFRRFESSLSEQLCAALGAAREAMQMALQRRAARAEEIDGYVEESVRSVAALSELLSELEALVTLVAQLWVSIKQRDANRVFAGDPWDGRSLEWSVSAPPPEYNFAVIPVV